MNNIVNIYTKEKYEDYDISFNTTDELLKSYENDNIYILKLKNSIIKIDKIKDSVCINTKEYNMILEKTMTISNLNFENLLVRVYTKLNDYHIKERKLMISYEMYDENFNFLNGKEINIDWSENGK